jgi:hypothetical protein
MASKLVVSEVRVGVVKQQIAELESRQRLVHSGEMPATAQEKVRLEEQLDISRRLLRALSES